MACYQSQMKTWPWVYYLNQRLGLGGIFWGLFSSGPKVLRKIKLDSQAGASVKPSQFLLTGRTQIPEGQTPGENQPTQESKQHTWASCFSQYLRTQTRGDSLVRSLHAE